MMTFGQALIATAGSMVDLMAAIVIVYHVVWAIAGIVQRRGSDIARLRIAQGVLIALGFSVAGTLLKIIALQTWQQIRAFTFIYVLRTFLKRVFTWEERSIQLRSGARLKSGPLTLEHSNG